MPCLSNDGDTVVHVTSLVSHLLLFFVNNPVLAIDHILVEVVTLGKMESGKPLVGDVIEAQVVPFLPTVK